MNWQRLSSSLYSQNYYLKIRNYYSNNHMTEWASQKSASKYQLIYPVLYIVLIALSSNWIKLVEHSFSQPFMIFIVSLSGVVIYNFSCLKDLRATYQAVLAAPHYWFLMSVTFALTWWLVYYSTIQASPQSSMTIFYLTLALLGCVFDRRYVMAVICAFYVGSAIFLFPELTWITRVTIIISSIACYMYMRYSELYAIKNKLEARQVLAVRFYLLLMLSIFLLFLSPVPPVLRLGESNMFLVTSLAFLVLFNLLPNFIVQKGVVAVGTEKFSQLSVWAPVSTFALQGVFTGHWSVNAMLLCLSASLLLVFVHRRG